MNRPQARNDFQGEPVAHRWGAVSDGGGYQRASLAWGGLDAGRARAEAIMDTLAPEETLVLRLRFGRGERAYTEEEVAEVLGISSKIVRQIEDQALRKLRLTAVGPVGGGWLGWDEV